MSACQIAHAWGNEEGHRHIIRRAVAIIDANHPGEFGEVVKFKTAIADGAEIEDTRLFEHQALPDNQGKAAQATVVRHFHNPFAPEGAQGLSVNFYISDPFTIHKSVPPESAIERSIRHWGNSLSQYIQIDSDHRRDAYKLLGRIAHLATGDLYQPQHTHNDAHLPGTRGDSTIEYSFDNSATRFDSLELAGLFAASKNPLNSTGISTLGNAAAFTAHELSRFSGTLPEVELEPGFIVGPGGQTVAETYLIGPDANAPDVNLLRPHFEILSQHDIYVYDGLIRGDIVWYRDATNPANTSLRRRQDWWELPGPESEGDDRRFYLDPRLKLDVAYVSPIGASTVRPLSEYYIDKLIPQSYIATAELLVAAAKAYDPVPPEVVVREDNAVGIVVPPNGYSRSATIHVRANDKPGEDGMSPNPSGIYRIALRDQASDLESPQLPEFTHAGEETAETTFPVAEGEYSIKVCDGTGNCTEHPFTVDRSGPSVSLGDGNGNIAPDPDGFRRSISENINATFQDAVSGICSLSIHDQTRHATYPHEYEGETTAQFVSLGPLDDGTYLIEAKDCAGNTTLAPLVLNKNPVKIKLASGSRQLLDTARDSSRLDAATLQTKNFYVEIESTLADLVSVTVPSQSGTPTTLPVSGSTFSTTYAELPPGDYVFTASDGKSRSQTIRLKIGTQSLRVDKVASIAAYDPATFAMKSHVFVEGGTSLGLKSVALYRPQFNASSEEIGRVEVVPPQDKAGVTTPSRADFPNLTNGLYYVVSQAMNGEEFEIKFDLRTSTFNVNIPADADGHVNDATEVVQWVSGPPFEPFVRLNHLGRFFVSNGTYISASTQIDPDWLGGVWINDNSGISGLDDAPSECHSRIGPAGLEGVTGLDPVSTAFPLGTAPGPRGTLSLATWNSPSLPNSSYSTMYSWSLRWQNNPPENDPNPKYWLFHAASDSIIDLNCVATRHPLGKFIQYKVELFSQPSPLRTDCTVSIDGDTCGEWGGRGTGRDGAGFYSGRFRVIGHVLTTESSGDSPAPPELVGLPKVRVGPLSSVDMPGGDSGEFFDVTEPGEVYSYPTILDPPSGYYSPFGKAAKVINTGAKYARAVFNFAFDPNRIQAAKRSLLRVIHFKPEGGHEDCTKSVGTNTVSCETNGTSPFMVVLPESALDYESASTATVGQGQDALPAISVKSRSEVVSVASADIAASPVAAILAARQEEGEQLVGVLHALSPQQILFLPQASATVRYSTAAFLSMDLDTTTVFLGRMNPTSGAFGPVQSQMLEVSSATIRATLPDAAGLLGAFALKRDRVPPTTELKAQGPTHIDESGFVFVATFTAVGLSAEDLGSAKKLVSGVETTYLMVEPTSDALLAGLNEATQADFERYSDAQLLPAGSITLAYGSRDLAGNFETLKISSIVIDGIHPISEFLLDGASVQNSIGVFEVTTATSITLAALDPEETLPSAGVESIEFSLDDSPFEEYVVRLRDLSLGDHPLRFRAKDRVGNYEELHEVLIRVRAPIEDLPPITTLLAAGTTISVDGTILLSGGMPLSLAAEDAFSFASYPSGVSDTFYSTALSPNPLSSATASRFTAPFTLNEGTFTLRYFSMDFAGNVEVAASTKIHVDDTAPIAALAFEGHEFEGPDGTAVIAATTTIRIDASDPQSPGGATGLLATIFLIDADPTECGFSSGVLPPTVSSAPAGTCANPYFVQEVSLATGPHTITYLPIDRVGNLGELSTAAVHVDADPPSRVTDLVATAVGDFSLTLAWTAPDDEVAGVGLYRLWYATVPFDESTLTLALPARDPPTPLGPGSRQEAYVDGLEPATTYFFAVAAVDRVANQASLSIPLPAATRLPDRTPPVTTQSLDGFFTSLGGVLYLSTATSIILSASEAVPPPGQSARGVAAVYYTVDPPSSLITAGLGPDTTAQFSVYPGSFTLAEGPRTLAFGAADNAGNYEQLHVASFTVVRLEDHDAPTTRLVAFGTTAVLGADLAVTAGSLLALAASDDLPTIGASGIGTTRLRLNGIETPYSAPFTLPSGSHTLTYWSIDRAGNLESPTNLTVIVPPGVLGEQWSLSFGGFGSAAGKFNPPQDVAVDASGNLFVSDFWNARVQKFSSGGGFLSSFGSRGTGPGQFGGSSGGPTSLAVSKANGNVLVMDPSNRRVQEFTAAGIFVRSIVGGPAFSFGSTSVDTDRDGTIFVMDDGNQRVYRFSSAGQQLGSFAPTAGTSMLDLAVGFDGAAVIGGTNSGAQVIQRYALTGELLDQWPGVDPNAFHFLNIGGGTLIKIFDQSISKVAVDLQGTVFVGDDQEKSVRIYSSTGGFLAKFGPNSGPSGTLSGVAGLGVGVGSGKAYVADNSLYLVKGFSPRAVAAPSQVVDLSLALQSDGTLAAQWTAPGAEGSLGTAALYELRQSTSEIDAGNYYLATAVAGLPPPAPPGTIQTAVVDGLSGGATIYLALRTFNIGGAVSDISNVPSVPVPFIGRSDVKIGPRPEVIILSGSPLELVRLDATQGLGAEVRVAATSASLTAVSGVYSLLPAGPLSSIATGFITIQVDATRAAGFAEGELGMYTFDGETLVRLPGQAYDEALARFTAHLATAAPIGVFGPVEDVLAPVTRLEIESGNGLSLADGGFLISGPSKLRLVGFDPISKATASGVAATIFTINTGFPQEYDQPIGFPEGRNTLAFHSIDHAGNAEVTRSSAVLVDATAPHAHLVIRESTAVVVGNDVLSATAMFDLVGIDPVVNAVSAGIEFVEASVDGAPFFPSTAPFSLSLGTGELAFRARDRVGNLSDEGRVTLSKPPWPAKGYAFSGKFGSKGALDSQFTSPQEIAVDIAGDFYVSDTSKRRIFKFTKGGQFLFSFGGAGSGPGQFGGTFGQFGIATALDASGNLYVGDSDNRRVQKFSPTGQFLGQISTNPATGQFYFSTVSDLALDSAGNLWVLDTFSGLKKFSPEGAFLGTFSLGFPSGYNTFSFTIGPDDTLYVAVWRNVAPLYLVYAFDKQVQFLRQWASPTLSPRVSSVDFYGNIVLAGGAPGVITVVSSTGAVLSTLGTGGPIGQNVASAGGAAVDKLSGRVYISDASLGDIKYFDVDQVAPEPPIVASPPPNAVLRTFSPTIVGRAEGASLVTILEGATILASTRVPTDGMFQVRVPNLAKGPHALRLTAQDRSGNVSAAAFVRLDTQYPNPASFGGWSTVTVTSGLYPGAVKAVEPADFDLDGRLDLLAFGRNGYALFRGMLNGSFTPVSGKQFSSLLDECSSAASGDINGDSFPDIVAVCRYDSTRLVALLGTGTTTLGTEQLIHFGTGWSRIALTDWNRDGKLDIMGAGPEGGLYVLYGQGGGVFQAPTTVLTGSYGVNFAVADLDADGWNDIAFGNRVLFGDGQGGIAQTVTLAGSGLQPIVGDFNADGKSDLWIAAPGQFSAFVNIGARSFVALTTGTAGYGGLSLPEAADLNRDGLVDALLEGSQFVPAKGDAAPGSVQTVITNSGGEAILLDTDGDGLLDIVQAANQQSLASLFIYRNLSGEPDVTAPAPITQIVAASPVAGTLTLAWTAPGDDAGAGTASSYAIKLASYPIDASDFDAVVNPEIRHAFPVPSVGGTPQTATVGGFNQQITDFQALPIGVTYFIRIRTTDEVDNSSLDTALTRQPVLGADLALSTTSVRFEIQNNTLVVSACPENKGPAASPTAEIAIVAGPSSGTPTDLAAVFWSDGRYHIFAPGDCHQGTFYNLFDAGDEFSRSYPTPSPGRHAFGIYLRMYPGYVSAGLDPNPTNDVLHLTVGIGEDGQIDDTPPAAVTDLVAVLQLDGQVRLSWTAPGDDASSGAAKGYEIRVSSLAFPPGEYDAQSVLLSSVPATAPAGSLESRLVSGFPQGTTVYFALRTFDDATNPAEPSNLAQAQAPFVAASPAPEGVAAELTFVSSRPVTVDPIVQASTAGTVILAAAGDQGLTSASGLFEVGPDGVFDPPATLVFRYSTSTLAELGLTEEDIAVYEFFSGQGWVRLANQTLDAASGRIIVSLSSIASQFGIFGVLQDRDAPTTALRASGGASYEAPDGTVFRSSAVLYGFLAKDPVVHSTFTDIAFTEYRIGASTDTPFQRYTTDFLLAEGRNLLAFRSKDNAGNLEVERSSTVLVDATPPLTTLRPSATFYVAGTVEGPRSYAAARTSYALDAQDPVAAEVASGVGESFLAIGTAPLQAAPTAFALSEGVRLLTYGSRDHVGNAELLNQTTAYVDATAPETTLSVTGPSGLLADGVTLAVSSHTVLTLMATDPEREGVASGLRETLLGVDTTTLSAQVGSFLLPEPRPFLLSFKSVDNVLNEEESRTAAVVVDTAPPSIATAAPAAGDRYVARGAPILINFSVLDAYDPAPSSSALLIRLQDRGSPAGGRPDVVAVRNGQAIESLDLDDGIWELRLSATDFILNGAAASGGAFEVLHDVLPPRTSLAVGQPSAEGAPEGALFVTGGTELSLPTFDDLVALEDGIGLGVARQDLSVDGVSRGSFVSPDSSSATFRSTFTLHGDADGLRLLAFSATDALGNAESVRVATVAVDNTSPITSLAIAGGQQIPAGEAGTFYASTDTVYGLPAVDPQFGGVAVGVDGTFLRIADGGPTTAASTFTLSEGRNVLAYWSRDRLGNLEVARSTAALVDGTPPVSAALVGDPSFIDEAGVRYVSSSTLVALNAQDPALPDGTAGSSLDRIEVSLEDGPSAAYASSLTLAEGRRVLRWRALDRVGNCEGAQSLELRSDASAPETSLAVLGGRQAPGPDAGSFYASSDTRFALLSADPVVAEVTSGLDFTRWQDNGGPLSTFSTPLTLTEGAHLLAYQSRDRVENLEVLRSTTILVDASAPQSAFAIGTPFLTEADGTRFISPATPVTFTAQDPALPAGTPGSGVERIEVAVDGGSFAPYSAALTFPEGRHTVQFRAVDRVGNFEAVQSLTLRSDASAPMTSLAPQGGRQAAGPDDATFYASSDTRFALSSFDPVAADVASGLEFTRWRDSGGAFQTYSALISLSEGSHLLAYQSQDRVENLEVLRSTTVLVDETAPQSSFSIGTPALVDTDGTRYVTPTTQITFAAQDPALPGGAAGSGVERIEVSLNGGAYGLYSAALTFPEGRHTVQFRAIDRVGNVETAQTLALRSDNSAPHTSLTVQGGTQAQGPDAASLYASSATRVVLTAIDPTVADVASGVDLIWWQDNGGPLSTYIAPLTLAEGAHLLAYQSRDRVENLEVLRSTTILLDATAPQSAFAIGTPSFTDSDGTRFISPATPVSFTAQDPALPGGTAGSGVDRIEVAVDGGAFAAYSAPLTFPEGRHTVQFRAVDRVGNIEATQSLTLRSDNSAPQTSLAVQGGRQVAGQAADSFYASSDTRLSFAATDPSVADVASGVDFTRWQDSGGAFQMYSAPIALTEGSHLLSYQSQDHVSNLEAPKSTTVIVDASAPNSAFAIGAPSFVDGDGTRYITPGTPVSFSAQDPALPGETAGAGVERIEVAVDGGAFAAYTAALTFPEGRHTVHFRAIDRVGNVEATQSLALRSDASAPQTSMAAVGGRQAAGPDAATFYASGDSRFVFPASDPVVDDVASGLDFTRWQDGSGAFQPYSAPVALAEGSHPLIYQSQDRVANLEILRSTTVLVDASTPQTAFAIGAPSFVAPDGTRYVTPATPVTFSASDPALPGGTAGSGVDRIEVAVDGAAFTLYTAALTFPEGRHTVQFRAVDRVGNSEAAQTLALRSDATTPQTAFSPSAAFYSNAGRDYAPTQFTYTLPAADPQTSDVASGVAETTFGIDDAPRQAYTGAFSLSEGIRAVSFGSRDNVSNLEGDRSATVHVDATAPQTSLAVSGGRQAPGPDANSFYASLDTRLNLTAMDPSVSGVASGLDSTSWQDNGGAFQSFGAPIALGAGSHLLSYRSQDHVGNLEVLRSTTVLVDGAAPVTAFQIGSPAFTAADGTRYVTPTTPVTFTASDPALAGGTAGSGVERIEVSVDGAPFSAYTSALTFAEGRHTVQYRAMDRVGNIEDAGTLALRSDASAPLTSLAAQGGRQVAGPDANTFYASLDTRFALPAADPVVSDVAAGVDTTRWQSNGGAFETYTSPLALAEGSHLLAYQSQDKVQNQEVLRSTTVLIDATAPITAFSIGAPSYTDAAGVHYVTPTTPVTFSAQDPALPGGTAGSGVERIEVALDAAEFQTYSAALIFAEGRHSIRFRAYDRVGNVAAERTLEIRSDASAPLSSLAVEGGRQTAGPDAATQYASADTRVVLSASDPLVADVASGVDHIRWRDNGGAFQTYTAPIALAEGSHVLTYQSQDKVQNVETLRSTTVLVDATAPHTAFQIGTPAFIDLSGTRYITPMTPVTFTAEDPALPGGTAGSGVELIEVAVDGGAFVTYAAALTFPEGRHTVQFRAFDRVGNVEAAQTLALRSDVSAPLTSLDIQGGRQAVGASATTFYASSATRYGLFAADPVVADVASGVEFTRWRDNGGALISYSGPIAFPEGVHLLTYASEDRVDNVEAQKAVTALVDATPPITQFSLNGPRYAHAAGDLSVGGELFVSPTTSIELASLDPVSNGVASGLERLLASPDGGPFLSYAGAISFFQEGTHAVAYRAADRVGNEEGTRSVSVAVDATAPSTKLTFDGPALIRGPGTTWEPQQAEAFITPVTKVILNTNDPTSAGIASGVKLTRFRIDSGPWQVYGGFFYLSNQGLHLVEFAAEDRVGNLEAIVAKRIAVDNTSPLVSAAINGSWLEAFGLNLLSTAATVSLAGNDSPMAGVAVGLARILYSIDDGGLFEYAAPFALAPGTHTVKYHGVDLLGNSGAPKTLSVRVSRFLGGSLAGTESIDGSGTADVSGLLQTNGGLSLTGNFAATGGAEAFSISLKGGAALAGPVTQGVRPLVSDSIDLAAIQAALGAANDNAALPAGAVSGGVLRLNSGQTVTLATGSYLLSGIDVSGGAKLLTAGPVRIFVTGSVKLAGNSSLNEAGPARNLVIFGSGPSADLNSAGASAVMYMPSAELSLSGGMRLGGSALAASVRVTGNSNATAPGLDAPAPVGMSGSGGQGGRLSFASLGGGFGVTAGADPSFVLRDLYVFPNPAVGGARSRIHMAVGVADRVTIRIYDISGQLVNQVTIDSPPTVIDDGSGPKFAYEWSWDGHIPSGVYLYTVVAEKNGQGAIRKTGKFAVVR